MINTSSTTTTTNINNRGIMKHKFNKKCKTVLHTKCEKSIRFPCVCNGTNRYKTIYDLTLCVSSFISP